MKKGMDAYISEFAGTFLLVFFGAGAVVFDELNDGLLGAFGIAVVFGLSVFLSILLFGKLSGSHINPAVTLSAGMHRNMKMKKIPGYIIGQFTGGIAASFAIGAVFKDGHSYGATLPHAGIALSLLMELVMSFILVFAILLLNRKGVSLFVSALMIGTIVFLEAYFGGPYTGASMNPARSFGPAMLSGNMPYLWIYLTAPVAGGLLASRCFLFHNEKEELR